MKQATPEQIVAFLTGQKMTDIADRLCRPTAYGDDQRREAADEIRQLRGDNERLRAELTETQAQLRRIRGR